MPEELSATSDNFLGLAQHSVFVKTQFFSEAAGLSSHIVYVELVPLCDLAVGPIKQLLRRWHVTIDALFVKSRNKELATRYSLLFVLGLQVLLGKGSEGTILLGPAAGVRTVTRTEVALRASGTNGFYGRFFAHVLVSPTSPWQRRHSFPPITATTTRRVPS
jgi:hypothetical protein